MSTTAADTLRQQISVAGATTIAGRLVRQLADRTYGPGDHSVPFDGRGLAYLRRSERTEIKKAVEKLFDTRVANVRVANFHGKVKRQGRFEGKRPDWKKAWVKLAPGSGEIATMSGRTG